MRLSLLAIAALCATPLAAACDLNTTPTTPTQQVSVSGFLGKGIFSDSVVTGSPFQLVAADSSGQKTGRLIMAGDVVPPAGTYDIDNNRFPTGFSRLAVEFVRGLATTAELYETVGGSMALTAVAQDSIAGTLNLTLVLSAICASAQSPLSCQQLPNANKLLTLNGNFAVRRSAAAAFPPI